MAIQPDGVPAVAMHAPTKMVRMAQSDFAHPK